MKKIPVDEANVEEMQQALNAANDDLFTPFTAMDAGKLTNFARLAEKTLSSSNIAESDRPGAKLVVCPPGPATPIGQTSTSTEVTLSRTHSGWYMTKVKCVLVYPRRPLRIAITITDRAANNMVKRSLAVFGRVPKKAT